MPTDEDAREHRRCTEDGTGTRLIAGTLFALDRIATGTPPTAIGIEQLVSELAGVTVDGVDHGRVPLADLDDPCQRRIVRRRQPRRPRQPVGATGEVPLETPRIKVLRETQFADPTDLATIGCRQLRPRSKQVVGDGGVDVLERVAGAQGRFGLVGAEISLARIALVLDPDAPLGVDRRDDQREVGTRGFDDAGGDHHIESGHARGHDTHRTPLAGALQRAAQSNRQ